MALSAKPDMKKLLETAKLIISRTGHSIPDSAISNTIDDILIKRDNWEVCLQRIITKNELANLLLAHLDTLTQHTCGKRFYDDKFNDADTQAMRKALFGDDANS